MMRVTPQGLAPLGSHDGEVLSRFAEGSVVSVEPKQTRNMKHRALYWCVLGRVVDNTDWASTRVLNNALLIECGFIEYCRLMGTNPDGSPHIRVEARDLSDLDEDEFRVFFELALSYICEFIIVGMDPKELLRDPRKL